MLYLVYFSICNIRLKKNNITENFFKRFFLIVGLRPNKNNLKL